MNSLRISSTLFRWTDPDHEVRLLLIQLRPGDLQQQFGEAEDVVYRVLDVVVQRVHELAEAKGDRPRRVGLARTCQFLEAFVEIAEMTARRRAGGCSPLRRQRIIVTMRLGSGSLLTTMATTLGNLPALSRAARQSACPRASRS